MSVELQTALSNAMQLHQSGQLDEAIGQYRPIIEADDSEHQACHLLALVLYQQGDRESACRLWQQAITTMPNEALYRNNCGEMLRQLGRLAEAGTQFAVA